MIDWTKIRHVIWDWNGTLLDDVEICYQHNRETILSLGGKPVSKQQFLDEFDLPIREFYEQIGYKLSDQEFEIIANQFQDNYAEQEPEVDLHDFALEILKALQKASIGQSILSAHKDRHLKESLNRREIRQHFEYVFGDPGLGGSCKIDNGKELINLLGVHKENLVYIGDMTHDRRVAETLGIQSILIANGLQSKRRLIQTKGPVLDSLLEVLNVVGGSL